MQFVVFLFKTRRLSWSALPLRSLPSYQFDPGDLDLSRGLITGLPLFTLLSRVRPITTVPITRQLCFHWVCKTDFGSREVFSIQQTHQYYQPTSSALLFCISGLMFLQVLLLTEMNLGELEHRITEKAQIHYEKKLRWFTVIAICNSKIQRRRTIHTDTVHCLKTAYTYWF